MAGDSDELKRKYEQEYERGYGGGPFGICEVTLCRGFHCNPIVSVVSGLALWGFVTWCLVDPEGSKESLSEGKSWVTECFTWLYIGSQDIWLFWLIPLSYYYGHVKLGRDDEQPEFSDLSYFSMVFCAGVAIGLIFYGASEPLWHYLSSAGSNRHNNDGHSNQNEMMQNAMNITIFHWGLQAWVVYAMAAISMGLVSYRQGLPLCFRSTLAPLFGRAAWGWFGDLIDVVTIVTVVAGLCTSLGLGAKQSVAGMQRLGGSSVAGMQRLGWLAADMSTDEATTAAAVIVVIVTGVATLSVISGVGAGVKRLSQTAFVLGNFLLVSVFFMDNPWYLLNSMVQSLGYHAQHLLEISFFTDAFAQLPVGGGRATDGHGAARAWMDWWTIFYWGWWISWAPFVGTFLARISRGRTILNVLMFSMTVPFCYALVWFVTFGGAGLRMHHRAAFLEKVGLEQYNNADYFLHTSAGFRPSSAGKCFDVPASLPGTPYAALYETNAFVSPVCLFSYKDDAGYWFDLMNSYHGMGPFLSTISIFTILLYFVTSSDSGSLVVDLIAANGREAHVTQRIFWALTEGAVAVALLLAGGQDALKALQAMSIIMGLPFTVIMMLMVTSTWRALKIDQGHMPPISQRPGWKMPLYGGIFDWIQFLHTLGRARPPKGELVVNFALGLFAPPLVLLKVLRGLASRTRGAISEGNKALEAPSPAEDLFVVLACGLLYLAFWILHILQWAGVNEGLYGLAWAALVAFATTIAVARYSVRKLYRIVGNPAEDFFAALFLWPQVLAQLAEQLGHAPSVATRSFEGKRSAAAAVSPLASSAIHLVLAKETLPV
eukprot:CAMPEP_0171232852 /NCGR_PEP_ID=MMETSP0790-20130122/40620_1 /TAXON_ID=2925 /ORGANISM="Alexandrium catenella, Strain OF101" /LENGTH=827 /DNA_ID=CAMNT_0011699097 /DNA_START=136 /DNA_END=2621 /DNA_ORIENTATION=+